MPLVTINKASPTAIPAGTSTVELAPVCTVPAPTNEIAINYPYATTVDTLS